MNIKDYPETISTSDNSLLLLEEINGGTHKISFNNIFTKITLSALKTANKTIVGAINSLKPNRLTDVYGDGSTNSIWVKLATIHLNSNYPDSPIEFTIGNREREVIDRVFVYWSTGTTHTVKSFTYYGNPLNSYVICPADGTTFDFYSKLNGVYDNICVYESNINNGLFNVSIEYATYPFTLISTPPNGSIYATYYSVASHDTSGKNIAKMLSTIVYAASSKDLLTYASNIAGKAVFMRTGNVVSVSVENLNTASSYKTTWNDLITIPAGYRPMSVMPFVATGLYGETLASMQANGDKILFVNTAKSTTGILNLYFNVSYITHEPMLAA